jgi:hypothetical protein
LCGVQVGQCFVERTFELGLAFDVPGVAGGGQ